MFYKADEIFDKMNADQSCLLRKYEECSIAG